MEIERKYLVKTLPENLENYECKQIAQGYLCTSPVVRIRRSNDTRSEEHTSELQSQR